MPPIQTIASPYRDRISVAVPKEYRSYSFQVILVPLVPQDAPNPIRRSSTRRKKGTFVDALLACPKLDEELDIARDRADCGREIVL